MPEPAINKNLRIPLPVWQRIEALGIKNVNAWIIQAIIDSLKKNKQEVK